MSNSNQPTAVYTGYKHSCVVDAAGYYKDLVQVHIYTAADGTVEDRPQYYTIQAGDRLIDTMQPTKRPHAGADGLIRPCWDDETAAWVEGATADEIMVWEAEHPEPEPSKPTPDEQMRADIDFLAAMQGVGL